MKPGKPRKAPETGPAIVVLLTNVSERDAIYAVAKGSGKTALSHRVRDFGTVEAAEEFIAKRLAPAGYRATVDTVERTARKIRPKSVKVRSAVGVRALLPGQASFLEEAGSEP